MCLCTVPGSPGRVEVGDDWLVWSALVKGTRVVLLRVLILDLCVEHYVYMWILVRYLALLTLLLHERLARLGGRLVHGSSRIAAGLELGWVVVMVPFV